MRVFTSIAIALVVIFAVCGQASADPSETTSLRTKMGFSAMTGIPDILGVSLAFGYPNILEVDGGVSYRPISGWTAYARLGYPWVAFENPERKYLLFVVPKVGIRKSRYDGSPGIHCPLHYCDQYTSSTCEYRDVDALGLNVVLSFEPTFWITDRLGLLLQISGGATFLIRGRDNQVEEHCSGGEEVVYEEPHSVRPDLKIAIGFVF